MAEARKMGKSELFAHFAERFEWKRTQAREFFEYLTELSEKELKRSGEFTLPGMVKLYVRKTKARMGRNPATGEPIKIPAKTVAKARIPKQMKDARPNTPHGGKPPPAGYCRLISRASACPIRRINRGPKP